MGRLRTVTLAILVILLGLARPTALVARQQQEVAGPRYRAAFAALPEGKVLRVAQPTGMSVGRYGGMRGDSLVLLLDSGSATPIPLQTVMGAWTRSHHTGRGALIGGIVGALVGGLGGAYVNGASETTTDDAAGAVAVGAIVIGLGGAALGALIGAAVPGWKPLRP